MFITFYLSVFPNSYGRANITTGWSFNTLHKKPTERKAHDIDCDLFQCVETIRPGSIHNARQWPLVRHPSAPAVPLQPETHGGYIAGKDFAIYRREVHSNLHVYETDSKGFRSGYIHA